jgi:hypothetical protein
MSVEGPLWLADDCSLCIICLNLKIMFQSVLSFYFIVACSNKCWFGRRFRSGELCMMVRLSFEFMIATNSMGACLNIVDFKLR